MKRWLRIDRPPGSTAGAPVVAALAAAAILAAIPLAGRAEDNPAAEKRFGPLEKSLLIPGWGQISEKRYLEGFAFLAAEVGCLYAIFRNNHLGNESYALYKAASSTEDAVRHRRATENYDRRRNAFFLAAAAVWAVNLVDIYLIVKSKSGGRRAVSLRIERDAPRKICLSLACRF
jgi:hypothetical protein